MAKFQKRVRKWMAESETIREGLATEGREIIARLGACGLSRREIARISGLSTTYISLVGAGKETISPAAYLKLAEVESRQAASVA